MKIGAAVLVFSLVSITPALVMGTTIAQWTFESTVPSTAGPFSPEIGGGIGTASHSDISTVYSNPAGNGSTESWSANYWNVGDYFQFQVSTMGYMDITVSWDQYRSATAPATWDFAYRVNGVNFTVAMDNYSPSASAWSSGSSNAVAKVVLDLSGVSDLANATSVYFRIVADSSASGTGGASRIDNFAVTGTHIPDSTSGIVCLGCSLGLLAVLRRISSASSTLLKKHA